MMRKIIRFLLGTIGGLCVEGIAVANLDLRTTEDLFEAIVITEAGGERFEGQVAVAEVLRNRGWNPQGFVGVRGKEIHRFLSEQPRAVRMKAKKAIRFARAGSDLAHGATHFENIEAFGVPFWVLDGMEVTATIGNHTFFHQRKIQKIA